nr:LysE family transporter [Curvibacter sp. CHRR-16]
MLAVISPGADFAMITRNSVLHGRRAGLVCAAGIAAGVCLHVLYTLLGVAVVLRSTPQALGLIKLLGAAYLVYVGWQTWGARVQSTASGPASLSAMQCLRMGFLTNALNPKTTLFVLSVFTQVVHPGTPWGVQVGYGAFMALAHWGWFAVVALLLSQEQLRQRLLARQIVLNRCIALALGALGAVLALSQLQA